MNPVPSNRIEPDVSKLADMTLHGFKYSGMKLSEIYAVDASWMGRFAFCRHQFGHPLSFITTNVKRFYLHAHRAAEAGCELVGMEKAA